MDLLDWHRGRLTSRRLAVLVKHMPRDSAVSRELDGDGAEWTVTDYLLAAAVDHLAAANWMFASVNTDEDAEPPEPPAPVPRPGDATEPEEVPDEGLAPSQAPSRSELLRFFA
ncbi:hypothetical protein ACF1D2_11690 [Streptomyces bacillaris]|uniref:Uncharacterized protein n=2 Tax=Streptomyces TaxID=1883 RepID=A0A1E7LF00_9ACTN|nr:hypothetical protein [Streptomyces nanshensis]OEV14802.1 hypothetical protein AN221_44115 [Streptomyces nanshensis]QCW78981.1 hypothetical protein EQG64_21450 [Streptomyces sp. S6]